MAVSVTLQHGDQGYFCQITAVDEPVIELLKHSRQNGACVKKQSLSNSYHHAEEISLNFEKVFRILRVILMNKNHLEKSNI